FYHTPFFMLPGLFDIGSLGGASTLAYGINNEGAVIGTSQTGQTDPFYGSVQHAFRWTLCRGMEDLGTLPGGVVSGAFDINSRGDIVGYSTDGNNGVHAVEWDRQGTIRDLGAIAANFYSTAFGISHTGLVTGGGSFPNEPFDTLGTGDAFLVDHDGSLLDL